MTAARITRELRAIGSKAVAEHAQGFFKTGVGEYGHGDQFIGVRVPQIREIAKENRDLSLAQVEKLLASRWHEARLCALHILVLRFAQAKKDPDSQKEIYELYLANTEQINNWDLVDCSAYQIVGGWLMTRSRAPLYRLARSKSLWERRISMMATWIFIRDGQFDDTMKLAEMLLGDKEDLIHKMCGWMLREVAKRDEALVTEFLERHGKAVPRTMLRYAIERYAPAKRKRLLAG
jgi:3-methyladenine DNA glycosylase AlkD